jgi:predicted NUDIX family NTP pyrophosphohydrolase
MKGFAGIGLSPRQRPRAQATTPAVPTTSAAGLLVYRLTAGGPEVLLVHPGGPFWARKDLGAWSVPKGEVGPGEDLLCAAHREFEEELGARVSGPETPLGVVHQRNRKHVHVWAIRADFDPATLRSNTFELEWPPGSGKMTSFPEVDRAEWFPIAEARRRLLAAQVPFLDRLLESLSG